MIKSTMKRDWIARVACGISLALSGCDAEERGQPVGGAPLAGATGGLMGGLNAGQPNGGEVSGGGEGASNAGSGGGEVGGDPQGGVRDASTERARLLAECLSVIELENGTLCAVQPSSLDPETLDAAPELPDQRGSGFGYHVVAVPHTQSEPDTSLWVHFGGTYGRPFDRSTGKVASSAWLNELMGAGYAVIQPAYDNKTSISFDCGEEPGKSIDNCAGDAREEVLTGQDRSTLRDVNQANSVDHRLASLLAFVQLHAPSWLPEGLDPANLSWPDIKVSGHSQGGNLSYYIARRRGVRFACMLAAPFDAGDSVNPGRFPIADWFTEGESLTPVERLAQLVATEDPYSMAFLGAGRLIGLVEGEQSFTVSDAPYVNVEGEEVDGHSAPLADPNLASIRAQACLR